MSFDNVNEFERCWCHYAKHDDISRAHAFLHEATAHFLRQHDAMMRALPDWGWVRTHWKILQVHDAAVGNVIQFPQHGNCMKMTELAYQDFVDQAGLLLWRDQIVACLENYLVEQALQCPQLFEHVSQHNSTIFFRIRQ